MARRGSTWCGATWRDTSVVRRGDVLPLKVLYVELWKFAVYWSFIVTRRVTRVFRLLMILCRLLEPRDFPISWSLVSARFLLAPTRFPSFNMKASSCHPFISLVCPPFLLLAKFSIRVSCVHDHWKRRLRVYLLRWIPTITFWGSVRKWHNCLVHHLLNVINTATPLHRTKRNDYTNKHYVEFIKLWGWVYFSCSISNNFGIIFTSVSIFYNS